MLKAARRRTKTDRLNRKEAAVFLDVTTRTLRQWERLKIGPPVHRIGPKTVRYELVDLQAHWQASRKCPVGAE